MRTAIIRQASISLFLVVVTTCNCLALSVEKIDIIIRKPGEINVAKYPKIALGYFADQNGQETSSSKAIGDLITESVLNLRLYEVLDRQHMIKIADEHNLKFSEMFDISTAKQFGKYIGASALICGRIQIDSFLIEYDQYRLSDKENYITRCIEKYTLAINLTVIDIESGKIITIKNLKSFKQKDNVNFNNLKDKEEKDRLFLECANDIADQFSESITFKKIKLQIEYETDDRIPETKEALLSLKLEETYEAIDHLYRAISSNRDFAKLSKTIQACVYYDLGLIQTYAGDYDEACQNLKTAIQLNPDSKRYMAAYEKARDEKTFADQLRAKEN